MTPNTQAATRILKAITDPPPPLGRRAIIFASATAGAFSGTVITLITTVYGPHTILAIHYKSTATLHPDRLTDALISTDTLLDANAAARDTHISGLPKGANAIPPTTEELVIPVSFFVPGPRTYYKQLTINNTAADATLQCIIEMRLRGTR